MASVYTVTCHVPDNADVDRRIQGLGGPDNGGWYHLIDAIIHLIEAGISEFWATDSLGRRSKVVVAQRYNGKKYLKTEADGIEPNNLLKLPSCR